MTLEQNNKNINLYNEMLKDQIIIFAPTYSYITLYTII